MQSLRRALKVTTLLVLVLSSQAHARVIAQSGIVIAELQTASTTNASSEFVRIANNMAAAAALSGWRLQYKSASGTSWTTKATLSGSLDAKATLLIATSAFVTSEAHQTMSDGLAEAGGHVQLLNATGSVLDLVGWGTASGPEVAPSIVPPKGQSLRRLLVDGVYVDTENNQADFSTTTVATPSPGPSPVPPPQDTGSVTSLASPQITELLPNPAAPATDAHDEFVELYNPNNKSFVLSGFKLQTGSNFSYSLVFTTEVLPPGGYAVFTSGMSKLTLSNTVGIARLLDGAGAVVSQTDSYSAAPDGQSWASFDGAWAWTTTPTPGADNILSGTVSSSEATSLPGSSGQLSAAATKTTAKKKTSTAPTKAVKSAQTKPAAKTAAAKSASPNGSATPAKSSPVHPVILAVIGGLAVAYGVYEYRYDLGNIYHRLRNYRSARRRYRKTT